MTGRLVVTGASGLLGPYLLEEAARHGEVIGVARSGPHACDLADAAQVARLLREASPRLVVHSAGFTDVDGCERDPERADRTNRATAANLAAALPDGAQLVYISTDQVYSTSVGLHREGGEAPINVYGRSKLAGEEAARSCGRALVLRTNFFGPSRTPGRQSLSDFVAQNLRARQPIKLFRDVYFSPLHMVSLTRLVFELATAGVTGVFNAASRDGMTKRDFGRRVAAHLGLQTETAQDADSVSVAGRAPRPLDLRMDPSRLEAALGRPMPTLAEEIDKL